jgi:hypothetical protein
MNEEMAIEHSPRVTHFTFPPHTSPDLNTLGGLVFNRHAGG